MREKKRYTYHATGLVNLTLEQFWLNDICIKYGGERHASTGYYRVKSNGGHYKIDSEGVCRPCFSTGVCGWTEWDRFSMHDLTRPQDFTEESWKYNPKLIFEQSFDEVYSINHGDSIIVDCLDLCLLDGMTMREAIRGRRSIDSDWSASVA